MPKMDVGRDLDKHHSKSAYEIINGVKSGAARNVDKNPDLNEGILNLVIN